ncbi:MAG: hypothetical protein HUU08_15485 [Candidatus Brocadia sp.]|nr:hypothetical protein [Candidatus Brocadia sp.]
MTLVLEKPKILIRPNSSSRRFMQQRLFVLVKILKDKLEITKTMNEILQILSISIFDKTPVNQLLKESGNKNGGNDFSNQLSMFNL